MGESPDDVAGASSAGSSDTTNGVSRLTEAALAAAAIVLLSVLGHNVLFYTPPFPFFLGAISGIVAALACRRLIDAVLTAAMGTAVGVGVASLIAELPVQSAADLAVQCLEAAALAAVVAALVAFARQAGGSRAMRLFAAIAVVLGIACGWLYAMQTATRPAPATWADGRPGSVATFFDALRTTPTQTADSPDATIFLALTKAVASHQDYYRASVEILGESNRVHVGEPVPLDQTTSYRMPTLYLLLGLMPQDGFSQVLACLVFQAVCAAAAFFLARRYVSAPFAVAAAVGTAAYFAALAPIQVMLFAEVWAGGLGLIAVTLALYALDGGRRSLWLHIAAAAVALLASLTRELAIAFVLAGLAASLVDAESRARRHWIVWAAALVAFAGAYALHAQAALSAFHASGLPSGLSAGQGRLPWLHADGKGLAATIQLGAAILGVGLVAGWVVYAAGVLGGLMAPDRRAQRVLLGLVVAGGSLVLAIAHTAAGSGANATVPGFWGMVVLPSVFACVPLVFSRVTAAQAQA